MKYNKINYSKSTIYSWILQWIEGSIVKSLRLWSISKWETVSSYSILLIVSILLQIVLLYFQYETKRQHEERKSLWYWKFITENWIIRFKFETGEKYFKLFQLCSCTKSCSCVYNYIFITKPSVLCLKFLLNLFSFLGKIVVWSNIYRI